MVARCGWVRVQRRAASERVSEESASHCRSSVWKADAGSPSAAESQASYRPHKLVVALWMDEPLLGKRFWLVVVSSYHPPPSPTHPTNKKNRRCSSECDRGCRISGMLKTLNIGTRRAAYNLIVPLWLLFFITG